jgi:hypothetical protein
VSAAACRRATRGNGGPLARRAAPPVKLTKNKMKIQNSHKHARIHTYIFSINLARSFARLRTRARSMCVCVCVCVCGVWCICILYHTGTRATALSWWNHGNNTHDWQAQLDAASKVGVV